MLIKHFYLSSSNRNNPEKQSSARYILCVEKGALSKISYQTSFCLLLSLKKRFRMLKGVGRPKIYSSKIMVKP